MSWTLFFLLLSLVVNIVLAYYSIKVARKLLIASSNVAMLQDSVESFLQSLQDVHESEMFYGDQTLQALIEQSKELAGDMRLLEDIFSMAVEGEEVESEEEETEN